jgi:hypothetical protein
VSSATSHCLPFIQRSLKHAAIFRHPITPGHCMGVLIFRDMYLTCTATPVPLLACRLWRPAQLLLHGQQPPYRHRLRLCLR